MFYTVEGLMLLISQFNHVSPILKTKPLNIIFESFLNQLPEIVTLGLQVFTEWIGKTPDELITEAEEESTILMRKRNITRCLIGFKKCLQDQ
jgi:hypothetical protein